MSLNPKQRRFVDEYMINLDATQAAIRAGYSARTAGQIGFQLLQKTSIGDAIKAGQAALAERAGITAERVLRHWWDIATADPNDLIQLRRNCCRHCHGEDHRYQWAEVEYRAAVATAEGKDRPPPDIAGGLGFDRTREPRPDCPECRGEGVPDVHPLDTRRLKGKARLLYAGVKQTKEGLEIKMRDQDGALDRVARHLGMFVDRHEHTGKDGGPIETLARRDPKTMSDEELDAYLAERSGARA